MEDRRKPELRVHNAILRSLASILVFFVSASALADVPPNIQIVPVSRGLTLAVHPNKPVLYVGREASPEGKNLVTFALDDEGRIVEGSRRDHADGLLEKEGPLPKELLYEVGAIAVHPSLPRLYLSSVPQKYQNFRAEPTAASIASLALDENGLPREKVQGFRLSGRNASANFLATNPDVPILYVNHRSGWLTGISMKEDGELAKPEFQIKPPMKISFWVSAPQWHRYYAIDRGTQRTSFMFSADGRSCPTVQHATTTARSLGGLAVSAKFRKLYSPEALPGKLGVFPLTQEGGFTGVPRYFRATDSRFVFVDDARNELITIAGRSGATVFALDEEGYPTGEPKRFSFDGGGVVEAIHSRRTGQIYLACQWASVK